MRVKTININKKFDLVFIDSSSNNYNYLVDKNYNMFIYSWYNNKQYELNLHLDLINYSFIKREMI